MSKTTISGNAIKIRTKEILGPIGKKILLSIKFQELDSISIISEMRKDIFDRGFS